MTPAESAGPAPDPTIDETAALLRKAGHTVTPDGRILPELAAQLLAVTVRTLANRRAEGKPPHPHYGVRITYSLREVLRCAGYSSFTDVHDPPSIRGRVEPKLTS